MEAFFRNDEEVQEWIDLFIEKLFTVSLLSGTDADSEFFQGRQAIEKIALFFQEMVELPEEAVMDGIRQLVEQRLPDSRVIENFPNFYQLMNEMILSGLPSTLALPAMKTTTLANLSPNQTNHSSPAKVVSPAPSSKIVLNGGWAPIPSTQDVSIPVSLRQHLWDPLDEQNLNFQGLDSNGLDLKTSTLAGQETLNESIPDSRVSAEQNSDTLPISETDLEFEENLPETIFIPEKVKSLAEEATHNSPKTKSRIDPSPPRRDPFRFNPVKAKAETVTTPASPIPQNTKSSAKSISFESANSSTDLSQELGNAGLRISRVVRTAQIPKNAERLAQVLKQVFPNSAIRWNPLIGKNAFYAQVDKVLVYIQETSSLQEVEYIQNLKIDMKKQGWRMYVCQKEDLSFPRRLERGLRLIMK